MEHRLTGELYKLERNRDNKEDVILEEAAKLFRHKGYTATTMDEIAAAVGLSKGVFFIILWAKKRSCVKLQSRRSI